MSENLLQRSVTTSVARNLANATKTVPQMLSITPRWLLHLLPWVQVDGGTYRVNRTKIEVRKAERVQIDLTGGKAALQPASLRNIPLFGNLSEELVQQLAARLTPEETKLGSTLVSEGDAEHKFFIIAQGQVEVVKKGVHGRDLRLALLAEGEYFGETELIAGKVPNVTVRTTTDSVFLTLSSKELNQFFQEKPELREAFQESIAEYFKLRSSVNKYGERHIDLVSGFAEDVEIPETFIDYSDNPREYFLSAVQTVVRVHTRVSDLFNGPFNQLEEQMRLTIEGMKERQEWDLINDKNFGLLNTVEPGLRISTRYGAPTPDDLDDLLSLIWKKPAFFLAHPKAIAAFERECTWRGVPPVTINLFGTPVITWRGVPLIPSDKLEIRSKNGSHHPVGTTSILLVRVGEKEQGVVGLHQAGIPGEISPSLSARLMSVDKLGVATYLLTLYFSLAVLTDDAVAVLENVEVGYYHDYQHRIPGTK